MKTEKDSLSQLKEAFRALLEREDRLGCIRFALDGLQEGRFDIPTLYAGIAGPVLAESEACGLDDHACIWREHVKSAIIRSVIECCFIEVMARAEDYKKRQGIPVATSSGEVMALAEDYKQRHGMPVATSSGEVFSKPSGAANTTVLVLCPEKEYHELGARMVTDFFLLNGWNAHFAGANTPRDQIRSAVLAEHPAIVAVSVSDFYNLVEAQKAIEGIRALLAEQGWTDTRIYVGGGAFSHNPDMSRQLGADGLLTTWADICALSPRTAEPLAIEEEEAPAKGGATP
jgi:methylmalonyl-CoA mutase cobalamin-binding subunit